jgi:protein TonB
MLAIPFESSLAKRPAKAKKQQPAPVVEPDTSSVYDTTIPSSKEFIPVEEQPVMIYQEKPIYPPDAKAAGIAGEMWVKAGVDKRGIVRSATVGRSSGNKSLDDAALAAAWKCKFKPAVQNGKPVGVWVTYMVEFKLDTSTEADSSTHSDGSATRHPVDYDTILPPPDSAIELEYQPEMIYEVRPVLPLGTANNLTGIVWIKAGVGNDGSVRIALIDKSSGSKTMDDAALAAARECRFRPAVRDHRPVASWYRYKVEFRMAK